MNPFRFRNMVFHLYLIFHHYYLFIYLFMNLFIYLFPSVARAIKNDGKIFISICRLKRRQKNKIIRGALSRAQVSPPGSMEHKAGSALYG